MSDTGNRPPFLEIEGLHFSYGANEILAGIDLAVSTGEVCCLMGLNGCGKSTLVDCILGVNHPSAGTIAVGGDAVGELGARELAHRLAYVPQTHERSFPFLVKDVVAMGCSASQPFSGPTAGQTDEAVGDALERCRISHLAQRPYTQLSGGEVQLVILARALVQATPFLLMDEPTAHLDFRNELYFQETVASLVRERGVGVLMTTHSPNQTFYFEDVGLDATVAMMRDGMIAAYGSPGEILTEELFSELYGLEAVMMTGERGGRRIRQVAAFEEKEVRDATERE